MNKAFDSISLKIASPDQIKEQAKRTSCKRRDPAKVTDAPFNYPYPECQTCSCGEVKKAETINYRSFRPEPEGLFCEAIFGPQKDWECHCGKYKRIKNKGVICDRCGVEVTQQRVRRDRLGYISLATPVSHIWYFKGIPSRIGTFCQLSGRDLERVLYFEAFIVVEVTDDDCPLEPGQVLSEIEYGEMLMKHWGQFRAGTGAEVVKEVLTNIDLEEEVQKLKVALEETSSQQKKLKIAKQLKQMADFAEAGQRPEWMILEVIPVIPPDLRPLVPLDGGRFATSDLNDLYRRVINRNNRLRKLIQLRSPDVILRNEKRMLQESVDAFFDNGRHGRRVTGPGNRPLKSLSDVLKGKIGRFRQNLLGKRVDYSGRSVIVVGPELGLHQCGIPKRMAVELFKPFIIERLQAYGHTQTVKAAKHLAERVDPSSPVWEVVEEVIADHPVLLNRPPTLHRLGIQAFLPVLVEGKSIRIPPLVCKAFNADFDGDQMAVHVPLTVEAQAEAKLLMLSSHNILKPSHGDPVTVPELDMVLGPSFLTKTLPEHATDAAALHAAYTAGDPEIFNALREKDWYYRRYAHTDEVLAAHTAGQLNLHDSLQLFFGSNGSNGHSTEPILTTVGRVIFNEVLPDELDWDDEASEQRLPFFNGEAGGRQLSTLIHRCFNELGTRVTTAVLEKVQKLALEYATLSGISPGITDYITPENRNTLVDEAQADIADLKTTSTALDDDELRNTEIRIWIDRLKQVESTMFETLPELETALVERGDPRKLHPYVDPDGAEIREQKMQGFSPVHIMADSGARARKNPFMQISAVIGLKAKQDGSILLPPITSSYRDGLTVLDYFNSTYGSRKGLVDTAMKTAASGYLTRKLVDVAQDVRVTTEDCGTLNGIKKFRSDGGDLAFKINGRTIAEDIQHPESDEVLFSAGRMLSAEDAELIESLGIKVVTVRSVLTCEAENGVCAKCYGHDLTTNELVNVGEAVGIIAAQSIGEPGTQLTMRTFHTGGAVEDISDERRLSISSKVKGTVHFLDFAPGQTVEKDGDLWVAKENSADLDGPAYKVLKVNHPECQLQEGELLSEKQHTENEERYKGFDTKTWRYEVTTVSDRDCHLQVGDRLSQAEYVDAQIRYGFQRFVTEKYRVTQVHHPKIDLEVGAELTDAEIEALRDGIRQQIEGEWHYLDAETNERIAIENITSGTGETVFEGPNAELLLDEPTSASGRDTTFNRIFAVTDIDEQASIDFNIKVGDEVAPEKIESLRNPFEVETKPIYIVNADVAGFEAGEALSTREYEDARTAYQHEERAFKVDKQEEDRHYITAVHHPECRLAVDEEIDGSALTRARKRFRGFDAEPLHFRITQVHHPDCLLKAGDLISKDEAKAMNERYPGFVTSETKSTAGGFEGEPLDRVTAVNNKSCPVEIGDLLPKKEASAIRRKYRGFEVARHYEVVNIEDGTATVAVGQRLTEIEYKAARKSDPLLKEKVTELYEVISVQHPDLSEPPEAGDILSEEAYQRYNPEHLEVEKLYSLPLEVGQRLTREEYAAARENDPSLTEKVREIYRVLQVNTPEFTEIPAPEDILDTIGGDATEDVPFPNIPEGEQELVDIDPDAIEQAAAAVEDNLTELYDEAPSIDASELDQDETPEAVPDTLDENGIPVEGELPAVGTFLTQTDYQKYSPAALEVAVYYEVTAAGAIGQPLTADEYESAQESDPSLAEKVTAVYRIISVDRPEAPIKGEDILSKKDYQKYNRDFKGIDTEPVYRIIEDSREGDDRLEKGTILSSKEYKALEKANVKVTHTITEVYHPNCPHTAGDEMPGNVYDEAAIQYPGFDTDELALQLRIEVRTETGGRVPHVIPARYSFSLKEGDTVQEGDTLADLHERTENLDIVAGIPRVTELFEARRPKRENASQIAEIEGHIHSEGRKSGIPTYVIRHEGYKSRLYQIPDEKRLPDITEGKWVNAGDQLTEGYLDPHDILKIGRTTIEGVLIEGEEAVWAYLVDEVQQVYGKGTINDKHVEAIVRQMLTKIRVTDPGDTHFYPNDEVQRKQFERVNNEMEDAGKTRATGEPILQGISKASLSTDSFISAASFQQTTKVLTDAAVSGQTDKLFGLKENVILGRLIPAGTGFSDFQNLEVSDVEPEIDEPEISEVGDDD